MARSPYDQQGNPQGQDPHPRPYQPGSGGQSQPQQDFSQPGEPSIYPPEPSIYPLQQPRPNYPAQQPRPIYPYQQPPPSNYRQPDYAPVNRQPNPNMAYQGVAAAKKGFPAWGWILIVLVTLGVLAGGGFAAWTYLIKPNANSTSQVSTPGAPANGQTGAGTTVAAPPASGDSNEIGTKAAGPGQELVGQSGQDNDLKVTITSVDRYTQLTDGNGKVIKANGAFLVISYNEENVGSQEHGVVFVQVKDSTGEVYGTTNNLYAIAAVKFSGLYQYDVLIQPGQKGKNYALIEVPADAKDFTLVVGT